MFSRSITLKEIEKALDYHEDKKKTSVTIKNVRPISLVKQIKSDVAAPLYLKSSKLGLSRF